MIVLFLLFLIQFSIACACLAVNKAQQVQIAEQGWRSMDEATRTNVQNTFRCCGVYNNTKFTKDDPMWAPPCTFDVSHQGFGWFLLILNLQAKCCNFAIVGKGDNCACPPCMEKLESTISYAFRLCGGIGLFFSFTEVS